MFGPIAAIRIATAAGDHGRVCAMELDSERGSLRRELDVASSKRACDLEIDARVREVEVSNAEAMRFERELDPGVQQIATTLARLEREHMIAEVDALTAALQRDLIDPATAAANGPRPRRLRRHRSKPTRATTASSRRG